jgi:AraC family transcriptional activator FtrA
MHQVVVLALGGIVPLDFGAAAQFFGHRHRDPGPVHYEFSVCSVDGQPVDSSVGVEIGVNGGLELIDQANTLIIPGYEAIEDPLNDECVAVLRKAADAGVRMVSICTGAFALGHAGLLDGRKVTTHWAVSKELKRLFPLAIVLPDLLYVKDGAVLSSGGVAAGIDLCLDILRGDIGAEAANSVARRSVVAPHRSGDQAQFVEHDVPATTSPDMAELLAWVDEHLDQPLTVGQLAKHVAYSTRSLGRQFQARVGTSPWKWVTRQRILRAQHLLQSTDLTIDAVATRCGFDSTVAFRLRFRETVHMSPSDYRRAFHSVEP